MKKAPQNLSFNYLLHYKNKSLGASYKLDINNDVQTNACEMYWLTCLYLLFPGTRQMPSFPLATLINSCIPMIIPLKMPSLAAAGLEISVQSWCTETHCSYSLLSRTVTVLRSKQGCQSLDQVAWRKTWRSTQALTTEFLCLALKMLDHLPGTPPHSWKRFCHVSPHMGRFGGH